MTELSPAARLVLACARFHPDARERDRIREALVQPIDWDEAAALAMRHGLAALVHRNLGELPGVPKRIGAMLWARAETVARRSDAMSAELCRVLGALEAGGVDAVPFKGPVLTLELYGELGLREFGDLDILVAPADVPHARSVLLSLGYSLQTPLDPAREELWLRSSGRYELPLVDAARGFMVELQWRANPDVPVPPLDDPRWWDAAPMTRVEGVPMRALPPDEQMLALLVHGAKHLWGSLDWLVDIAELARAGNVPWERVMELARRHGAARRMALGLELARDLLEAPLPAALDRVVRDAGMTDIAREIAAPLFALEYSPPTVTQALRMEIALCDSTSRRVRRIARLAQPTPGDWQWCRLPRALTLLYWAVRPVRLAAKYLTPRSRRIPTGASPRTPPPQPRSTN